MGRASNISWFIKPVTVLCTHLKKIGLVQINSPCGVVFGDIQAVHICPWKIISQCHVASGQNVRKWKYHVWTKYFDCMQIVPWRNILSWQNMFHGWYRSDCIWFFIHENQLYGVLNIIHCRIMRTYRVYQVKCSLKNQSISASKQNIFILKIVLKSFFFAVF